MPEDKNKNLPPITTNELNEGMGMGSDFKEPSILDDLDKLEAKIDEVNKNIPEPNKMIRPPLTNQQKIDMLNQIFSFRLGDKVRNLFSEDGIIEMVGIDRRGVIYLVEFKENNTKWLSEDQMKKIYVSGGDGVLPGPGPYPFRTDIPETNKKDHIVGDRKSKME